MANEPQFISRDHPFIWSPECYDICRICGGVRNGHPEPRRLKWTDDDA
jgi:hypothetical protein